jgi:WD40 repeat protein
MRKMDGYSKVVSSVVFSTRVVSGSDNNTVQLWDIATPWCPYQYARRHSSWATSRDCHSVSSIAFSLDGKQVVSGYSVTTIVDTVSGISQNARGTFG